MTISTKRWDHETHDPGHRGPLLGSRVHGGLQIEDGTSAIAPKQGEIAAAQLDKAKLETKEAAQSMREYAYAEKAEFVNKMQKELVDIQESWIGLAPRSTEPVAPQRWTRRSSS